MGSLFLRSDHVSDRVPKRWRSLEECVPDGVGDRPSIYDPSRNRACPRLKIAMCVG